MSNGRLRVKPFATESNLVQRKKHADNIFAAEQGAHEDKENVPIMKNKHQCQFCGRSFLNPLKLSNHINSLHSGKKPKSEVTKQIKALPHKCPLCKKPFATMVILMNHLTLAHYKQKFTCELCDLSFPSKEIFNLHVQVDHSKEVKEYKITKDKEAENKVPEEKKVPEEDKVSKDNVTEEKITKDKITEDKVTEDKVTEDKVVKDNITENKNTTDEVTEDKAIEDPDEPCHATLQDLNDSLEHWCKNVNPSIQWCEIDGEMFQTAVDYGIHLQIAHADSKIGEDFICDFVDCYSIFKSKPELKHHLRLVHSGISFSCRQCPRSFSSQQNRSLHNQVEHLGVRFVCNLCKLDFKRRKNAFVHLLSHPENQRKGMNKPVVLIPIKKKKQLKPSISTPHPPLPVEEPKWEVVDLEKEYPDSPKPSITTTPLSQLVEPKLEQDYFEEDLEEIEDDSPDLDQNPVPLITTLPSSHLSQVNEKCSEGETTLEKHSEEEAMMQIVEPKSSQHFDQNPENLAATLPLSQVTGKNSEGEKSMAVPNLPNELPNFLQFLSQNPNSKFASSSITQLKVSEIEKDTHNRPWKCTYCSDAFVRKQTLDNHIKSKHLRIKALKCCYCDRNFATSNSLYMHKRKKHEAQWNMEKAAAKASKCQQKDLRTDFQTPAAPSMMIPTFPTVPLPMNAINAMTFTSQAASLTPNTPTVFTNRRDDQVAVAKKSTILAEPQQKAMQEAVKNLQSLGYMQVNPDPLVVNSTEPMRQKRKKSDNLDLEIQKLYQQAKAPISNSSEASPVKVSDPTTQNTFFFKCEYCDLSYATAGSLYMHRKRKHLQNIYQPSTTTTQSTLVQQSGTTLKTSSSQQNSFPSVQNSVATLSQLGGPNPYLNSYPSSTGFFGPTAMTLQEPNTVNDANQVGDVADMVLRSLNYGAF